MSLPDHLIESARAVILLTEYQTVVHYRDGKGTVTRPVNFESVRRAFSDLPSDFGWLDGRVRRVGCTRGKPFLVASIPGQRRPIWIEQTAAIRSVSTCRCRHLFSTAVRRRGTSGLSTRTRSRLTRKRFMRPSRTSAHTAASAGEQTALP